MKSGTYRLFIAGALVAFMGCSRETPSVSTFAPSGIGFPTGAQMNELVDAKKKAIETLSSRRIVVKVQSCVSGTGEATLSAKGKAKGRARGKLTASAVWNFLSSSGQTFWTFSETFKIAGKHPADGTITGSGTDAIVTCKTFGPVSNMKDLTYHLGAVSGYATTNMFKNGGKLLEQLH